MPNMPATSSTWIALAPETLRERKMRSGISGVRAVASRRMKTARRARDAAPSSSVVLAPLGLRQQAARITGQVRRQQDARQPQEEEKDLSDQRVGLGHVQAARNAVD